MMPTIKDIERVEHSNDNAMQFILDRPLTEGNEYIYQSLGDAGDNDMAFFLLGLNMLHRSRSLIILLLYRKMGMLNGRSC